MAEWTKHLKLYVDVDAIGTNPLLNGDGSTPLALTPAFVQSDCVPLRLYFRTKADSPLNPSTSVTLPGGAAIVVAGKQPTELDEATELFQVSGFTQVDEDGETYYQATLDLNTSEIDDVFENTTLTSVPIRVDIEVQNGDNSERFTFQFDATLKQQVYDNDYTITPTPNPQRWEWFTHEGKECLRIKNGDGETLAILCPPGVTYP